MVKLFMIQPCGFARPGVCPPKSLWICCKAFLVAGSEGYKKDRAKFLQRFLTRRRRKDASQLVRLAPAVRQLFQAERNSFAITAVSSGFSFGKKWPPFIGCPCA